MNDFCVVVCVGVGAIALALIGLQLLKCVADAYMDLRNKMIQIKYGEGRIRYLNQHWNEIQTRIAERSDQDD